MGEEVFVLSFPGLSGGSLISTVDIMPTSPSRSATTVTGEGRHPLWSRDERGTDRLL